MQARLGWAALKAGHPADAVAWFEASRRSDPAQPVSAGSARALLATGNEVAARALLATMPDGSAILAALDEARIEAAFQRGDLRLSISCGVSTGSAGCAGMEPPAPPPLR